MVSGKHKLNILLIALLQMIFWSQAAAWETETLNQSDEGITLQLTGISGELQVTDGRITCSGPDLMAVAVDSMLLLGQKALFIAVPHESAPIARVTAVSWVQLGQVEPGLSYSNLLESHATARLRQQNLLPLTLRPFRLQPDGRVEVAVRITFQVDFNSRNRNDGGTPLQSFAAPESPVFEQQLQSILLNYEQGSDLRRTPQPQVQPLEDQHPDSTIKIMIEEDGVYRVSWNWLNTNGLTLTSTPSFLLRLYTTDEEIPIKVFDGQDGYFESGDYFVFYGRRQRGEFSDRSRYTPKSAYFLEYSGQAGTRMVEVNSAPVDPDYNQPAFFRETVHQEEDLIYDKLRSFNADTSAVIDHWYWREYEENNLRDAIALGASFPYHHDPIILNTTLRASFTSLSWNALNDHHIICELNGQVFAGDIWWDGLYSVETEFTVPDSILTDQGNTLLIWVPGDSYQPSAVPEHTYLNWVEIEFDRRFKTADDELHFSVEADDALDRYHLTGYSSQNLMIFDDNGRWMSGYDVSHQDGSYSVTFQDDYPWEADFHAVSYSSLKEPFSLVITQWENLSTATHPVDYIIIYHSDYLSAAQEWAALWGSRYSVRLVNVENIYDTFGRGTVAPEPIRDFLAHAWANWPAPAFSYVLLMGRGNYMFDKLASRKTGYIKTCLPVYLAAVPHTTITSSDEYFACFEGDDEIQDCLIGRLPMTSMTEFNNYYDKMIDYDFEYEPDLWHLTHTLISDSDVISHGDTLMPFSRPNKELIESLCPPHNLGTIIDISDHSDYHGGNYELRQLIDAGTTTVSYLGHGAITMMSAHGILNTSNYQLLNNQGRYPLGFAWSCLAGSFDHVNQKSVSELLVSANRKGYIASFGSAALALSTADSLFLYQYYNAIFEDNMNNHGSLGQISWDAELALLFSGYLSYHTRMFNLLGDPALQFAFPRREISVIPHTSQLTAGESFSVDCQLDSSLAGEMSLYLYRDDGVPVNYDPETGDLQPVEDAHLAMATTSVIDGGGTLEFTVPQQLTGGFYRLVAYFDGGDIDGYGAARVASERPVLLSSSTIPAEPQVGDTITFVAEVDPLFPPDSLELFFEGKRVLNGINYPLEGENGQYHVEITDFASENYPVIQRYRYRLFLNGDSWVSPGFTFFTVVPSELAWVENSFTIGGQTDVELNLRLRNEGQSTIGQYQVLVREGVSDTLALYSDSTIIAGESVPVTIHFDQEQGSHSITLEASILGESDVIMQQLDYLLVGPPGVDELPLLDSSSNWRITAPAAALTRYIAVQPQLVESGHIEPHTGQPGFIRPLVANHTQSDLLLELLADSAIAVPELELSLLLERPLQITQQDTALDIPDSSLFITLWDSLYSCWVPGIDPIRIDQPDSLEIIQSLQSVPLIARLSAINDATVPQVDNSVSSQFFAPGDYVARSPDFGFTIEDLNGIDYGNRQQAPVLYLDGEVVDSTHYMISGHAVWGHLNLSLLDLEPNSLHSLELEAWDLMGNRGGDTLSFTASGFFGLLHVATHPNPFTDEVIIAWELTDVPKSIQAMIYTSSGRHIRTLVKRFPHIGYDEMIWDGLDDLGRSVANGVYYLKFITENDTEKVTKIVKLARLR